MFGKKGGTVAEDTTDIRTEYEIKIKKLEADHEIALKEKEFALKHNTDERVREAADLLQVAEKKLAESQVENKMLREMVDLNSDIVDVKELVQELIKKLPEIKLDSLVVNNNSKE